MDSRWHLKDGILLLLVAAVGGLVLLAMVQEDRRWAEVRDLRAAAERQTSILADIERRLRERGAEASPAASPGAAPLGPSDTRHAEATTEPWARPGVPVVRPPAWAVHADPRAQPGFAPGGTMTELLEGAPRTLTPYLANDPFAFRIASETVLECLAALDARSLELRGWLAEAWQPDPEGRWLRVKIRDEARFSTGEPVTAEDLRFTFMDFVMNHAIDAGPFRGEIARIERIEALAPTVAEFHFKEPSPANLRAALRNFILPRSVYGPPPATEINGSAGLLVGSGPYRLEGESWSPGSDVVLVRNERWWGAPATAPPIDRLVFRSVPDNAARLREFEERKGDLMRCTPEQLAAKRADPAFATVGSALAWTTMRSGYVVLAWNCGQRNGRPTVFADPRVRRAMVMAIDRERLNREVYAGLCTIATGPFPDWQGDPDLAPLPFDIEAARAVLAQAGWIDRDGDGVAEDPGGRPLEWELTSPRGSVVGERAGPMLIDMVARLGARLTIRTVDAATLGQVRSSHDFDAIPTQWSWSDPEYDPFPTLHSSQIEGGDNWIRYASPAADALIEEARRTIDPTARRDAWRRLHRVLHEEQPCAYLLNVPWTRFVSTRLANVRPYPVGFDRREWFIPADRR
jgi:peptide/nickel transport system substrate-binding protein